MKLIGKVWKFGDNLSVFDLLPAKYDELGVNENWRECAKHLLEEIEPRFPSAMRPGDIIVAGNSLGTGHAHYYRATILACKAGGIGALLATTTASLFQRAAIDQGLPVWSYPGIGSMVTGGEQLEMDLATGTARNLETGTTLQFRPLAPVILEILAADGAFNWAKRRVAQKAVQGNAASL